MESKPVARPAVDVAAPLHASERRLDVAFAAIGDIDPGTFVYCLRGGADAAPAPPLLTDLLSECRWIPTEDHPLTFVEPADHLRIHRTWVEACHGPRRVARAIVRVARALSIDDGLAPGPPGLYDLQLIDLIGADGFDVVLAAMEPTQVAPIAPQDSVVPTEQTARFRLRLTNEGIIKGGDGDLDELLGSPLSALEGIPLVRLVHPDDIGPATGRWQDVLTHPDRSQSARLRLHHADGSWRWFNATTWNAVADPDIRALISEFRDVHALVEAEQALHASELSFRTLAESMPVGIALLDEDGRVDFANHELVSVLRRTGLKALEAPALGSADVGAGYSTRWSDLIDRRHAAEMGTIIRAGDPDDVSPRARQISIEGDDGTTHDVLVSASTIRNRAGRSVIVTVQDVSAEMRTGRAHDRLVQVVDEVDDVVMVVDLQGRISYLNRAATQFLGPDATGRHLDDYLNEDLAGIARKIVDPRTKGAHRWTGDVRIHDRAGVWHSMAVAVRPVADRERPDVHIGITMRDVTTERAHERDLARAARHDQLTALPNRLSFMESLASLGDRGEPDDGVAVCFIDLDHLKVVNDGLGHSAGDRLLAAVATELRRCATPHLVARFGGDEFVVLCEGIDDQEAMTTAEDLLAALGNVDVIGVASYISASIGVATSRRGDLDPEALIRDADTAMYVAKRAGRSRCALFDEPLRERTTRRFLVEVALRDAVAAGTVHAHLQPVIALADGKVSGFEALSRWSGATPDEFIPVAEESGLIATLGEAMLESALDSAARIRASAPELADLTIGVNVSGRELDGPAYADRTLAIIANSGIPASHVILELTETVLIDPREDVDHTLRRLRDAGIALALDDFGVGYSSLTYLRRYPIDILKLDVSYTQALGTDSETRVIAEAMVAMADRLHIDVVAEGVETPEQLAVVQHLGIKWVQGFLLGRPAPVDELLAADLISPRASLGGIN